MTTFCLCNECGNRWKVNTSRILNNYQGDIFSSVRNTCSSARLAHMLHVLSGRLSLDQKFRLGKYTVLRVCLSEASNEAVSHLKMHILDIIKTEYFRVMSLNNEMLLLM